MTDNVIPIRGNLNVAETLRMIADQIDEGHHAGERATIILDGMDIFSFGQFPDSESGYRAIFDCQMGIHLMMETSLYGDGEED